VQQARQGKANFRVAQVAGVASTTRGRQIFILAAALVALLAGLAGCGWPAWLGSDWRRKGGMNNGAGFFSGSALAEKTSTFSPPGRHLARCLLKWISGGETFLLPPAQA